MKQFFALLMFLIVGVIAVPDLATFQLTAFRFAVACAVLLCSLLLIGRTKEWGLLRVDLDDLICQGEPGRIFQAVCLLVVGMIWAVLH